MVLLWLLIIGIVLFGALLLFGVWKKRPRWVECICGWFVCLLILASFWQSLNQTEVEDIAQKQFDITYDFAMECFSEWVDYYEQDYVYTAVETMIDCAIDLMEDTMDNLEDFEKAVN